MMSSVIAVTAAPVMTADMWLEVLVSVSGEPLRGRPGAIVVIKQRCCQLPQTVLRKGYYD